jgi:hypothetical protein
MSDFDESKVVRDSGGKFDTKTVRDADSGISDHGRGPVLIGAVKPGDTVLNDDGSFLGVAADVHEVVGAFRPTTDEERNTVYTRVLFANGAAIRATAGTTITVDRSGAPLPYSEDNEYWENVSAAQDGRQDPDVLYQIAVDQSEDDFMRAVCSNPASRADAIDEASKHHSFTVRQAAIAHPATSGETLQRILDDAIQGEADGRMRVADEGVSPMRQHYVWEADQHALIAAAVRTRLAADQAA